MTYSPARRSLDAALPAWAYGSMTMIRRESPHDPALVSDIELGISVLLLLIAVIATVVFVPGIA